MGIIRLLADMNISPQTVEDLCLHGWDIVRVSWWLPVNATDQQILELARRVERVVVTQDLDFSTLIALSGLSHPSLITLRLSAADPGTITLRLLQTLPQIEQSLHKGCAVTIEDMAVRIRSLPILRD